MIKINDIEKEEEDQLDLLPRRQNKMTLGDSRDTNVDRLWNRDRHRNIYDLRLCSEC